MAYKQLIGGAMVCEGGTKWHHLRPAASRDAARRSSTPVAAVAAYESAISLTHDTAERQYLERRRDR